jgi:hypothetical protein
MNRWVGLVIFSDLAITYQHPLHSIWEVLLTGPAPGNPGKHGTSQTILPLTTFHILQDPSLAAVAI